MDQSLKDAFAKAVSDNYWGDQDSMSGPGSNLLQTRIIRKEIPELLQKYQVKRMLDAPCGDLFWMKEILPKLLTNGIQYIGVDIVPKVLEKNKTSFESLDVSFYNLDLTRDKLPVVDLILTRDCFIHLSYSNILLILKNYKKAGAKYLLVSTYTRLSRKNYDVEGHYMYGRMLNMQKFPFKFPQPIELINEGCTEGDGEFSDKSLGLWKIEDLNLLNMEINITLSLVFGFVIKGIRKIKRLLIKIVGVFFD